MNVQFILNNGEGYSSKLDFGLIRTSKKISTPVIKTNYVSIPGRDGVLDFTEMFGEPHYENRTVEVVFYSKENIREFDDIYSNLQDAIHGKSVKIVFNEDAEWYYEGRVSVGTWEIDGVLGKVTVTADVFPYKMKRTNTIVTHAVSEESFISCYNERKSVVPTITADADFVLKFGDISVAVSAGETIVPDIKFVQGENIVTCIGTGNITFTYQEGSL